MSDADNINEKILKVITAYIMIHGYPPSFREIAMGTGLKSTSTVHAHIKSMIKSGMLETDAETCSPRALRVPGYRYIKVK